MRITHEADQCRFCMYDDEDTRMGLIEYVNGRGELLATHTEVYPPYEGQGLAGQLLDAMADYAADNDLKIVPVCGYVVRCFRRDPKKYAKVIKDDMNPRA